MNNLTKNYLSVGMWTIVILFTAGGMIQNFFVNIGFSAKHIGTYTSMINIIQIAIMLFGLFRSDSIKNVKKSLAFLVFGPVLTCILMIITCFAKNIDIEVIFSLSLFCCLIQNLFVGFYNVLSYKFPFLIIDMKDYTKMTNVGLIISGIISITSGIVITYLSSIFPFRNIMAVGFFISIVFCVLSSICISSMKIKNVETVTEKKAFSFKILTRRDFAYFYIPNFTRGCSYGLVSVISLICAEEITTDPTVISALVTILSIASVIGCTGYQRISSKTNTATAYLVSSIIMCIFLPLMVIGKSTLVFCTCFLFAGIGYYVTTVAGAVFAAEIVPYEDMGTYTSVRLIALTAGQALSSYLVGTLLGTVPTFVILLVAGLCQLISGTLTYLYKKQKKNITPYEVNPKV